MVHMNCYVQFLNNSVNGFMFMCAKSSINGKTIVKERNRHKTDTNGKKRTQTDTNGQKRTKMSRNRQKRPFRKKKKNKSCVTCYVSCVTCRMSYVMCRLSCFTCYLSLTPTAKARDIPTANSPSMHNRLIQVDPKKPKKLWKRSGKKSFLVRQYLWYGLWTEVSSSLGSWVSRRGQHMTSAHFNI